LGQGTQIRIVNFGFGTLAGVHAGLASPHSGWSLTVLNRAHPVVAWAQSVVEEVVPGRADRTWHHARLITNALLDCAKYSRQSTLDALISAWREQQGLSGEAPVPDMGAGRIIFLNP
jgi:hypothetical protein